MCLMSSMESVRDVERVMRSMKYFEDGDLFSGLVQQLVFRSKSDKDINRIVVRSIEENYFDIKEVASLITKMNKRDPIYRMVQKSMLDSDDKILGVSDRDMPEVDDNVILKN